MNIKFLDTEGGELNMKLYPAAKRTVEIMISNYLKPAKGDYISNGIDDHLEIKEVLFEEFTVYITL